MSSKMTKTCHQQSAISNPSLGLGINQQSAESRELKAESWPGLVRPAYTLIEMLISVTIFSGLLIIVLGTVASSSGSSAKVSLLRDKSQSARSLIDQISNDLRYADTTAEFKEDGVNYRGYVIKSSKASLVIALRLPNADPNWPLVRKEYTIDEVGNRLTLRLLEKRKCKITNLLAWNCDPALQSEVTDLLSSAYTLGQETGYSSELSGLNVITAEQQTPPISPFVSMVFTLIPVGLTTSCSLDPGTCYKVSTTVNMALK